MINGLPERLKEMRINCGYSQRTAAKLLEVSPSIISGYETGERTPSVEVLLALSNLYRCSTDYLLGRSMSKPHSAAWAEDLTPKQLQTLMEFIRAMQE